MLTHCPHSEAEITVAGTPSPFDRVQLTVMPAGSHERDMRQTVWGHNAICAMVIPFTACKHIPSNRWVGLRNHPNTRTARTTRVILPQCLAGDMDVCDSPHEADGVGLGSESRRCEQAAA